jgi:hypothetical protein
MMTWPLEAAGPVVTEAGVHITDVSGEKSADRKRIDVTFRHQIIGDQRIGPADILERAAQGNLRLNGGRTRNLSRAQAVELDTRSGVELDCASA